MFSSGQPTDRLDALSGSQSIPHAGEVRDEEYDPDQIDSDSDTHLLAQVLLAIDEHEGDERHLADTGNGQRQRAARSVVRSVDQHCANQSYERTPISHDNLGD
jgi:hypothetical protein